MKTKAKKHEKWNVKAHVRVSKSGKSVNVPDTVRIRRTSQGGRP